MPAQAPPASELIPGYKLLERLGSGGFGDVWKCEAPGGLLKAIKLVRGNFQSACGGELHSQREFKALERMKTVRHPFILSVERYDVVNGQLIIVMELADRSLWDRFEECKKQGLPGIPRDELLRYMEEVAEALDVINSHHQLQHLDIKPQNLFLMHNHIKVADFGQVKELHGRQTKLTGGVSPVYAASELFNGLVSLFSDQYSLAIVYQEMLTGQRPFDGTNARQLIVQHLKGAPNLEPLPPSDRPSIARALAKNPEERFPSCTEFARALRHAPGSRAATARGVDGPEVTPAPRRELVLPSKATSAAPDTPVLSPAVVGQAASLPAEPQAEGLPRETPFVEAGHAQGTDTFSTDAGRRLPTPDQLIHDLVRQAMPEGTQLQEFDGLRCFLDAKDILEHKCAAWLPQGVAQQKLEGFFQQWQAQIVRRDAASLRMHVPLKTSLWQWLSGTPPTLEIDVLIGRPRPGESRLSELTVRLRCLGSRKKKNLEVLQRVGPTLLNSLRSFLLATVEHRAHERFAFKSPMRFAPFLCSDPNGEGAVECESRDISFGGIRFHAPSRPTTSEICLYLRVPGPATPESTAVAVPASVRQVVSDGRGGYLVGARFLLDPVFLGRRALLIEQGPDDARRIEGLLLECSGVAWELKYADGLVRGLEYLGAGRTDVVLLGLSPRNGLDLEAFRQVQAAAPTVPVVVLIEPEQVPLALQAVQLGAHGYLVKKQLDSHLLARALHDAIERQRARRDHHLKTERQRLVAEVEQGKQKEHYLAYHDGLTGLPNRSLFRDRLEQSLVQAKRNGRLAAVLFLDLDGFKRVNDTLGHTAGDQLLQGVAERLKQCVRTTDTVARLGGDEFTIILTNITTAEAAATVAEKVQAALAKPLELSGQEVFVTTSIGISVCPTDGTDAETLVKRADVAMYSAKGQGKNTYQLYNPTLDTSSADGLSLESGLRKALEKNELIVHYQPQVDMRTRAIKGVEALVRWQHPTQGLISPAKFIPLAEETGLIVPLGEFVLRTACAQNRAWQTAGLPPIRVTVNLSARQFREKDLPQTIAQALKETGLAPSFLGLEITESCAVQDVGYTTRTLRVLKDMGVQLFIDDFGTGYSSLNYLKSFPVDALKIERSFIKGIPHDRGDVAITTAVIGLAHSLDLKVIAEFVETEEQLAFLQSLDCDELQSYLFSRPLPAEAMTDMLVRSENRPVGSC